MNEQLQIMADAVKVENGQPVTTSLKIAEVFGKRHSDVIRAIESLQVPDGWHKRNFAPMLIDVQIGNGAARHDKAYRITRDGFTLLAMGFTGTKAMQFKLAYIEAFNKMEKTLQNIATKANAGLPSAEVLLATLQVETEKRVRAEVEGEQYRRNLERIARMSNLTFGEISAETGLPKDIVIAAHCKSSKKVHSPQQHRYVQLILPLQMIVDECRKHLLGGREQ